jgi:hypothetical protein
MISQNPTKTPEVFSRYWPWLFFAAAFESILAVLALLLVPSESGLSIARLAMLAVLFFFFISGIYLGILARRDTTRFDKFARTPVILSSALLAWTLGLILFLLRYLNPERLLPYYERLSPLLWYIFIVALQSALFLLLVKNGFHLQAFAKSKTGYLAAGLAFALLLVIFLFASITKIGLKPDTAYWGEPGVAIQGWQFILSILLGFVTLLVTSHLPLATRHSSLVSRFLIPALIYVTAVSLWLSVPWSVLQNSFYAPITPPANIPFPYSDAGFYDYLSQSLLIGTDYLNSIPPRPLYVVFLAFLHLLFGQNYPAIIAGQTLVLALFPLVLYFLGKKLHSPAAGVTVALFAIFRELTGLWIASNTRVANSKVFTTDFPTAMGIALLCLVILWWLERRDVRSTLIAGGAFGLLMLFRTQSLLTLPVVFVLAWFVYQRKTKDWILAGVAFAVAMVITVLPWLTHNYTVTGHFTFDDPRQSAVIFSQYAFTGNLDESLFNPETDSVGQRIVSFTLANPGYVARFVTAHILNTEIGGLLSLPLIKSFDGLLAPINLYWVGWDGTLEWYNLALVLVYLAILAIGIGTAWQRASWLGLVPLAFNLGYAFSNGISRFSSWRYNMPVDWIIYFYFGLGIVEVLSRLVYAFSGKENNPIPEIGLQENPKSKDIFGQIRTAIPTLLVFMLVAILPWFAKGLASPRYTATPEQLTAKLEAHGIAEGEIQTFLAQPSALILEGRMLYPRMYRRNEGMVSANPWQAYAVRDFARIGFILLNDSRNDAIFITRDLLDFKQGADVTLLACQQNGYLDVRLIDFGDIHYQSASLLDPCSSSPNH